LDAKFWDSVFSGIGIASVCMCVGMHVHVCTGLVVLNYLVFVAY